MKLNPNKLKARIKKKGLSSSCNYRVVAVGIDKKGRFIGIKTNTPRRNLTNIFGKTYHAEENLIHSVPHKILDKIIIGRVGRSGNLLPIDPCRRCKKLARKYNIKIERVS